jgi:hypothetical protein
MIQAFLPDSVKEILLGLIAIVIVLAWLANRLPHVAWLQVFRLPILHMSEEEKARKRRQGNRMAALEIMVAGLVLPVLYMISTVMMFNEPKTIPTIVVSTCSLLCFAVGIWMFVRNR